MLHSNKTTISLSLAELVDTKYNSLRTYFVKQRRRVQESQRRSRSGEIGSIFRPSWPPYSKLLFLEEALAGVAPVGLSDLEDNEDLSLATMVPKLRRCSDLSLDERSSEQELALITMVKHSRTAESFYTTTEDNPPSDSPLTQDDGIPSRVKSGRIKTNFRHSGSTPEFLDGPRSSRQLGNMPSPITIDDESQEVEKRRFRAESGNLPLDSVRSHSPRPQSPIFPPTDLSSSHSVSTFTLHDTTLHPNTPNPLTLALSTETSPQSVNSRKRSLPNTDDGNLGSVFHDTIDSLRTVAESIREDANDDVGGFLKMIGFQLRNIKDPLRRMRAMHAIQGVILNEITSTIK